jgi:disulfide bond formation protein DsbB
MFGLTDWLRPKWPVLAFLASAALLAAAHGFERLGGYAPCTMCLDQRERHWAVLIVAALAFVALLFVRTGVAQRVAAAALGAAFAWSLYEAGHHVAVEQHWVVATCEAELDLNNIQTMSFEGTSEIPACDTPAWTLMGVSMAGYNALISLGLMLVSFAIAFLPARRAANG